MSDTDDRDDLDVFHSEQMRDAAYAAVYARLVGDVDRDDLRRLAHAAIPGDERAPRPGEWEPYYTSHGDPYVVEAERGMFGVVATVNTAPADYGRDRAAFIASCSPATILALLDAPPTHTSVDVVITWDAERLCGARKGLYRCSLAKHGPELDHRSYLLEAEWKDDPDGPA